MSASPMRLSNLDSNLDRLHRDLMQTHSRIEDTLQYLSGEAAMNSRYTRFRTLQRSILSAADTLAEMRSFIDQERRRQ